MSWLGLLYGANTVGAVIGCLLAGFYLLRVSDMATATFAAAAINVTVGLVRYVARQACARVPARMSDSKVVIAAGAWPVYVTIALSGATALAAEVIWTRLLGLMLGATVYTFSIILAVFLVGLGDRQYGRIDGSGHERRIPRRCSAGARCCWQAAIAWTAYMLSVNRCPTGR